MNAELQNLIKLATSGFDDWKALGNITSNTEGNLLILNYTDAAMYEGTWNNYERLCRGLIINTKTGEIVARPYDKFFNWGEHTTTAKIVSAREKVDGSLGIYYRDEQGKVRIATRGSFKSEQAIWATRFLHASFHIKGIPDAYTLLFEIVYPENQIVVNYRGKEDLVLLDIRNRFTGEYLNEMHVDYIANQYGFSRPRKSELTTVDEFLAMKDKLSKDEEGFVALFDDGSRYKFKGEEYLRLSRLLMGYSRKDIFWYTVEGTIDEYLKSICFNDEVFKKAKRVADEIRDMKNDLVSWAQTVYAVLPQTSQKDFALTVERHFKDINSVLFAMKNNKPVDDAAYWIVRKELDI